MSNEEALISKLIEETCQGPSENDRPDSSIDLHNYFKKKLNQIEFISIDDYLNQNNLNYSPIIFDASTRCYRLKIKQYVLDFPSNWSIFREIEHHHLICIDSSIDQDFLLDIFTEPIGECSGIVLIKEFQNVKIIFLNQENSLDHIKWMRNYFEKKNYAASEDLKISA